MKLDYNPRYPSDENLRKKAIKGYLVLHLTTLIGMQKVTSIKDMLKSKLVLKEL